MRRADIERNAEIAIMRKEGKTLKEISEWYEISPQRVMQICVKYSDGDTKEEIIRNYERELEEKRERTVEERMEYRLMADKRKDGREYVIMNGAEDLYLTAIETPQGHPLIYRYASANIHDALWFTLEEAQELARKRRARAMWVPLVR